MESGARIGPNAVTQVAAALRASHGEATAQRVFHTAGLDGLLADPPDTMTDERQVAALHRALADELGPDAAAVSREAGLRTGDYILAHRIPAPVRGLLKALPAPLAGWLLLAAIRRHAWTFAGSGRFAAHAGRESVVEIADNPIAVSGCPWHAAVFERLFQALVSPRAKVRQTASCADGAPACRFIIAAAPR